MAIANSGDISSLRKHKTIFISTGEVSGDLQGSLLIEALKRQAVTEGLELNIVALGGSRMAEAGATLLDDTSGIGSMGILESLPYVLPTLKIQNRAKKYLIDNPPDLVVLIDYMGPNITVGSYVRRYLQKVPIVYYIVPQVWVWSPFAQYTKQIMNTSDRLLAIFSEEARYFQERKASVSWVGHPLVDRMQSSPSREEARNILGIAPEQIAIALFPASRPQELKYLMPVIFQAAQQIQAKLSQLEKAPIFLIPLSLEIYRTQIEQAIVDYGLQAKIVNGQKTETLAAVDLAIAKSGTVNLELALLNIPQVVIYRINSMTYWFIKKVFKFSIPFMSPPNLVLMRSIVPEFFQEQATSENIVQESLELLLNPIRRQQTLDDYQEMRSCLGEIGVCDRAASEILQML